MRTDSREVFANAGHFEVKGNFFVLFWDEFSTKFTIVAFLASQAGFALLRIPGTALRAEKGGEWSRVVLFLCTLRGQMSLAIG